MNDVGGDEVVVLVVVSVSSLLSSSFSLAVLGVGEMAISLATIRTEVAWLTSLYHKKNLSASIL